MFAIIIFIAFLVLYARVLEHRSLYIPYRDVAVNPSEIHLAYEDVTLLSSDGVRLSGWYLPAPRAEHTIERVVYFLHGNGGNISHRLEKIRFFHDLGLAVLIVDYRGYGRSDGMPGEKGLYADARAGYEYLISKRRFKPDEIIVYGESLGAAVAIDLASHSPVGALILEGAFTSVPLMSKRIYPFLPAFLVASRYDSLSKIPHLSCPIVFIHSRNDEIVPFEMGQGLYEAYSGPKLFLATTGGHNEHFMIHEDRLRDDIGAFVVSVRQRAE